LDGKELIEPPECLNSTRLNSLVRFKDWLEGYLGNAFLEPVYPSTNGPEYWVRHIASRYNGPGRATPNGKVAKIEFGKAKRMYGFGNNQSRSLNYQPGEDNGR
jgi:hypothetical protein